MGISNNVMLSVHGYGLINPLVLDDAPYEMYLKAIGLLKEKPVNYKDVSNLFERQVGYKYTVPMQALLMSYENEHFNQYSVDAARVLRNILLSPIDGLLRGHKLTMHIEAAYEESNIREDGSVIDQFGLIIRGGRHRFVSILFILIISQMILRGIDPVTYITDGNMADFAELAQEIMDDQEFLDLEIPVVPSLYSLQAIARSNGSRTMNDSEKNYIKLQNEGLELTPLDIAKAILDKKLKAVSASAGWKALFGLLSKDEQYMTVLTAHKLGSKVYTELNKKKFKFPYKPENLLILTNNLWERVPLEVADMKKKGITNIARDGINYLSASLVGYALTQGNSLWNSQEDAEAEIKQSAAVETAPKKEDKATKSTKGRGKNSGSGTTKAAEKAASKATGQPVDMKIVKELTAAG